MIINFDNLGSRLSKEDILNKVSEEAIYKHFCKDFPSRCFKSPFRKDRNPSFGFYKKDGNWKWKDMASGEGGDAFSYVQLLYNISFIESLKLIASVFYITAEDKNNIVIRSKFSSTEADKEESRGRSLIQVIKKPMTNSDYEWWNDKLINSNILNYYQIKCAKEIWVDKRLAWFIKEDNPIYYWVFPFSNNVKCYRPLEKRKEWKWLSNANDQKDIQGYAQCLIKEFPKRPLILTKSMKECAFFRAFHINAMALNAEGNVVNPDFIRHIKKYCYPIISLYDNDDAGYKGAMRLQNDHNIPAAFIPIEWAKDPTDLWVKSPSLFYNLLNLIYDFFREIKTRGELAETPKQLHYPLRET